MKIKDNQEGEQTNWGVRENKEIEEDTLGIKICQELEMEDIDRTEDGNISTTQELDIFQQELGIEMNQEGLTSPKYGKPKRKRGRKSLKDLREIEGLAREQRKIDELLNIGKGKCLPGLT